MATVSWKQEMLHQYVRHDSNLSMHWLRFPNGNQHAQHSPACTAQHSTARHAQHSTAQHSTAQHSTAQHSTAQHSTARHGTARHGTHSTARHGTARHSTAQQAQNRQHCYFTLSELGKIEHNQARRSVVPCYQLLRLSRTLASAGCVSSAILI